MQNMKNQLFSRIYPLLLYFLNLIICIHNNLSITQITTFTEKICIFGFAPYTFTKDVTNSFRCKCNDDFPVKCLAHCTNGELHDFAIIHSNWDFLLKHAHCPEGTQVMLHNCTYNTVAYLRVHNCSTTTIYVYL